MTPTTPEQARELALNLEASTLMGSSRAADYLRSLSDQLDAALQDRVALAMQIESLTQNIDGHKTQASEDFALIAKLTAERNESDLMAECTTMLRNDLIEAGIVSETVPPMMLTEAIMVRVKQLGAECAAAVEAGHAAVEMCGKLINERDSLRDDAERYAAKRKEIFLKSMRMQGSGERQTEEEFNANYDANCDKAIKGFVADHRGVLVFNAAMVAAKAAS